MNYISDLTKGSICAGNFQVHVVSNIELHMYAAMAMAFSGDKKAVAWAVKNGELHLYSAPESTACASPATVRSLDPSSTKLRFLMYAMMITMPV